MDNAITVGRFMYDWLENAVKPTARYGTYRAVETSPVPPVTNTILKPYQCQCYRAVGTNSAV
ncbi:MAG: hypothetical protein LBS99_03190 [Clostridiales bacterium]|jgi:hypothetical protein|nr:hypothetical protein [Clostridiales bacterium]